MQYMSIRCRDRSGGGAPVRVRDVQCDRFPGPGELQLNPTLRDTIININLEEIVASDTIWDSSRRTSAVVGRAVTLEPRSSISESCRLLSKCKPSDISPNLSMEVISRDRLHLQRILNKIKNSLRIDR